MMNLQLFSDLIFASHEQSYISEPFITQLIDGLIFILKGTFPAFDILLVSLEDYFRWIVIQLLILFFLLLLFTRL